MKNSKILAIVPLFLITAVAAHANIKQPINANTVSFQFESFDGLASIPCFHVIINPSNPYDLAVTCTDGKKITKKFTAHLALSRYRHPTAPKVTYELVYWVNGNGATTWNHFEEETKLMKVESSQSITGEEAALKLGITLL